MRRGYSHVIQLFVALSIVLLIFLVIPLGAETWDQMAYGTCVGKTLDDVNVLIKLLKQTKSTTGVSLALKVTDCIHEVVFVNGQNWKNLKTGMLQIECEDSADAHILLFKRKIGYKEAIKSGEKITAKYLAPDVICKDIYDLSFSEDIITGQKEYPEKLEGPSKNELPIIYCLNFQIDQINKNARIYSWDIVGSEDQCKIK